MKKLLVSLLTAIMLLTVIGCSNNNSSGYEKGEIPEGCVWNLEGTIFPLKNKQKFTIVTQGYRGTDIEDIKNNKDWLSLCEAANVEIEFVSIGSYDDAEGRDKLQTRLMGEDYGDAIWSVYVNTLTTADIDELGETGIFVALDEYMENKELMPNFNNNIKNHTSLYKNMTSPDGKHYYLCGVSEIVAYTANEALMQVNSEWLSKWKEARGVSHTPETLAEFEDMLKFFKENDMNGNGKEDEIPYFIAQNAFSGCATLEHAMGMFGIATKDSTADMDIQIDDNGKCNYVYTTDTYKAALQQFADWYSKGYVWEEIFTGNAETITNTMAVASEKIGLFNACENIKGFEPILPPTIEGYKARYHMHPSVRLGTRQPQAVITKKCEHPDILAAFFDLLFNFDNYIRFNYGTYSLENDIKVVDGKYVFPTEYSKIDDTTNLPIASYLTRMEVDTLDNYNAKVDIDSYFGEQQRVKGYTLFNEHDLWNPTENLWPRCTILSEDQEEYSLKYTDVSTTVAEYRAKFVTGQLDIDKEWNNFQEKLVKLGVNDMKAMVQRAYDAFVNK